MQAFAKALCSTQALTQFVIERVERDPSDFEVLFFDEQIKRKLNRMSISKLGTHLTESFFAPCIDGMRGVGQRSLRCELSHVHVVMLTQGVNACVGVFHDDNDVTEFMLAKL